MWCLTSCKCVLHLKWMVSCLEGNCSTQKAKQSHPGQHCRTRFSLYHLTLYLSVLHGNCLTKYYYCMPYQSPFFIRTINVLAFHYGLLKMIMFCLPTASKSHVFMWWWGDTWILFLFFFWLLFLFFSFTQLPFTILSFDCAANPRAM